MDIIRFENNSRLETKLDSLELRFEKLQDLIDEGSYRAFSKKAKLVAKIERILFKRYKLINGQKLERVTSSMRSRLQALRIDSTQISFADDILYSLEQDRNVLDEAIFTAKAEAMGLGFNSSGLFGRVELIEGDCMPSTEPSPTCQQAPLATRVIIRPLTSINDAVDFVYFDFVEPAITELESNEQGYYALELEPGYYSVFVEDNGREYCNSFDWLGNACRIMVPEKSKIEYDLLVDHAVH